MLLQLKEPFSLCFDVNESFEMACPYFQYRKLVNQIPKSVAAVTLIMGQTDGKEDAIDDRPGHSLEVTESKLTFDGRVIDESQVTHPSDMCQGRYKRQLQIYQNDKKETSVTSHQIRPQKSPGGRPTDPEVRKKSYQEVKKKSSLNVLCSLFYAQVKNVKGKPSILPASKSASPSQLQLEKDLFN